MKRLKELADKIAAEHGLEWYQPLNKAEDSAGMTAIDLGNGYSLHHEHSDNGHDIWSVGCNGERAGTFMLKTEDTRRNKPMVVWAGLEKAHRGKGVGTLAYKALAAHYGGLDSDKASSSDDAIKAWLRAGGRQMKIKNQFGKPRYTLDGDKKNPPIVWNEDLKKTGWGEWQPEDLDDAIQYQTDAYGKKINQNKLQYSHTELMDPDDFENDLSAHTGVNEKGWLKQFPKSEWSERFTEEYGSNLGHIPKLYFSGSMNPGIAINGAFGDGRHRSLFYHAIGENMPVAHFFTNKKYKKNEDLVKGARGDWTKEPEYKLHISDDIHEPQAIVTYKNKKIGGLNTIKTPNGTKVSMVYVDPEHQRKGLATAMYRAIEEKINTKLIPSDKQTTEGQSLWSQPNRPFGKSAPSHSLHLINKFEGSDFAPTEFHYSVKSNGKEIGRAIVFDKDPRSIHQAGKTGPSLKDIRLHPDYQGQGHSQGIINKLVETHGPLASDSRGNISPVGAKMFHKYGIKQPDESYMLHGQSLKKSSNIDSLIQQAKARLEGVKKVGSQEPRPMIFANKDGKRHAFVTVDPSKKGQWRVTHFIDSKPAGHSEAPTFSHAIKVAHESGYNVFKEIPEKELFKAESLIKAAHPSDLKRITSKTNPKAQEIVDAAPHAVHAPDQAYVDFLNHPQVQKGLGKGDIGGISAKMVHKVGDDTYMAKPYHKKIESATRAMNPHPISGWSTMATRNLFHSAGIGHLCEDVAFHEHNGVPMTVHKFAKQAYNANAYGWRPDLVKNHIDTQGKQIAIMDFLTNNRDRHIGNVLFNENGNGDNNNLLAIDHERNFQYNQNFTENPNSYIKSIGLQYTQQNPNNPSFAGDQATKDWWKANKDNIVNSFNKDIQSIKDPHLKNHIHTNFMKRVGWLDEYSDPDHLDFFDDAAVPVQMFKERRPKTDYKAIMKNLPENPYKAIGVIDGLFSKKLSFATKETLADLWNEQVDKMSGEEVGNYLKDIQKTKNHPHPKGAYWSLMSRLAEKNHRQGMQHLVQNNMIDLPYWKNLFEARLKLGGVKQP